MHLVLRFQDFYEVVDDPAMQMVLFYLPNIAARLPFVESLLDFGAGPTIHVAICFRNKAENVCLFLTNEFLLNNFIIM
jgi:hypothetical protein